MEATETEFTFTNGKHVISIRVSDAQKAPDAPAVSPEPARTKNKRTIGFGPSPALREERVP